MPETALRIARHAREWGRRSGRTCPCACTSWLRTQPEIRTCHTDKCARKGSVQTTVFISRGRNGGAGREGARVPLAVKWWGWGWSRFRLYDSSEVPCARAARGASRKLPTANPHQCSVTIVRSKFIIPVRSGGRCAGAAAGGGRRSPCACTYTAGGRAPGRRGECPTRNRTPSTRRRTGYVHSTLVKRTNQTPRGAGEDPS